MQYEFRDEVRHALAAARDEAIRLGHDYVGTEHMLLGMLKQPGSLGVDLLAEYRATPEAVRSRLEEMVRRGRASVGIGELPYTSRAKKVLEYAMAESRAMRVTYIGTEHLLVGLLREEKGIAATVLATFGVTLERVRASLRGGVVPAPPAPERDAADGPAFRIELDDGSDRTIHEQIVGRVKEAAATGELRPGTRLPPVRQLADTLDIAPGTVARAYSELERLGVVVTDGARGTRVAEASTPSQSRPVDLEQLAGLLRPAAVAAFHMGARANDMRRALEAAMDGILDE